MAKSIIKVDTSEIEKALDNLATALESLKNAKLIIY